MGNMFEPEDILDMVDAIGGGVSALFVPKLAPGDEVPEPVSIGVDFRKDFLSTKFVDTIPVESRSTVAFAAESSFSDTTKIKGGTLTVDGTAYKIITADLDGEGFVKMTLTIKGGD